MNRLSYSALWLAIVVVVVAISHFAPAQETKQRGSWEYKIEMEAIEVDAATAQLNLLANEGWELVSVAKIEGVLNCKMYLKRLIK